MSKEPTNDSERQALSFEEIIAAALETRPMTPEERKALEEEYRKRQRKSPGRKKRTD